MLTKKGIKSILRQTERRFNCANFLSNKKYVLGSIVLIGLLIIAITYSFAVSTPTPSITVPSTTLSYNEKEEGSWQFTKTAKWISKGKARINIKLNTIEKKKNDYTDVVLVLDTSGSMIGDKLTQVQQDVNNLINDTIPKGNKIALITFNDTAMVVNDFTDDASLLQESINNLTVTGETNYYQALVKVDDVLNSYNKESNKDCVVLFLTDGLPTIDTSLEVGQYNYLKNKYNYLTINGIQYEFGNEVSKNIRNISDIQYKANKENLSDVLYKVTAGTVSYDKFNLTDYINTNYFNLNNISDINTTYGETTVKDNKVIWNLDGMKTGTIAELTMDINLNNNLSGGIYPTHINTDVDYEIESTSTTESTKETTSLKDNYIVNYVANAPSDCIVSGMPSSKRYSVFDTVTIDDKVLVCDGYQFKGWKIVTGNVEKVGNDKFIMPESDVTIKATWKKLNVKKSMDGKIAKVQTLYKLMADSSIGLDTDADFSELPTDANSGVYTIADTKNDKYPVHYYRGNIDNNNVLFAGFCWKMVRTTSTGGVKLIYNGVYDETNKCNNTGTNSQISTSRFNDYRTSPAYVGYMYGTKYTYNSHDFPYVKILKISYITNTNYDYYGTSITYSNGKYTLQNAEKKSWSDNYSNLTGYYTCSSMSSTTCSTVYYIVGTTSGLQYNLSLSGGITDPTTETITLGKGITDNSNNTYSLTDTVTVKKIDWYTNYNTYKNYYMCKDLTSTTCDSKYFITSTSNFSLAYDDTYKFVYGNDVSWDGTKYTLTDTYTSINDWSTDRTTIAKKYHYTCLNTTGECADVYYIHYFGDSSNLYYLKLSSGKNIEDAKNEMFANTTDSTMKQTIDSWYKANMTAYTEKLEDTIWCNDRTFYKGSLAGKDVDAGTYDSYFSTYNRVVVKYSPSVECANESRDGFTVSTSTGGNGKLTYPVGLLTADEVMLAGGRYASSIYLHTGQHYWLLSPSIFSNNRANGCIVNSRFSYDCYYSDVTTTVGVRPSISLAPGTKTTEGIGTVDDPYVIE